MGVKEFVPHTLKVCMGGRGIRPKFTDKAVHLGNTAPVIQQLEHGYP